ncbi:MAG: AAA family ATPase [Nitrososphaerales archaeon]
MALMRSGVKYDRARGFLVDDRTNLKSLIDVLGDALNETVTVATSISSIECYTCREDVDCQNCIFFDNCPRDSQFCLCKRHERGETNLAEYAIAFGGSLPELGDNARPHPEKSSLDRDGLMWAERYRPLVVSSMVSNEEVRIKFSRWLSKWKPGDKPVLLVGGPGTGKSTLVQNASAELGFSLIELNASDVRTREKMRGAIGPALSSSSLFQEKRVIFLDEVDGIYGRDDYGGADFIKEIITAKTIPLVMSANSQDDDRVQKIAGYNSKNVILLRLNRALPRQLVLYLTSVLEKENLVVNDKTLEELIRKSKGDFRGALNTLQASKEEQRVGTFHERDSQLTMEQAFKKIFMASDYSEARNALSDCDVSNVVEKIRASFQNIVAHATSLPPDRLLSSLRALSELDFLVRTIDIEKRYRFLKYFDTQLSSIIFSAKDESWSYQEHDPAFWSLRFRVWNDSRILRAIAKHVGSLHHESSAKAIAYDLQFLLLAHLSRKNVITDQLRLDESTRRVFDKEAALINDKLKG